MRMRDAMYLKLSGISWNDLKDKNEKMSEEHNAIKNSVANLNGGVFSFADNVPDGFMTSSPEITAVSFPLAKEVGKAAFASCSSLTSVDLPLVTTINKEAFKRSGLVNICLPEAKNIGGYCFQHCTELVSVDLPKVEYFDGNDAFNACSALTNISAPNLIRINNTTMFSGCGALTGVDFPKLTNIAQSTFDGCNALTSVTFPSVTNIETSGLRGCRMLQYADLPKLTNISSMAFYMGMSLKAVILRSETMCSLANTDAFKACYHILGTVNETYNPDGLKDGYIYVPSALVESYKTAMNWSTYADQFRALEDYTVDGTVTGELDESKIGGTTA